MKDVKRHRNFTVTYNEGGNVVFVSHFRGRVKAMELAKRLSRAFWVQVTDNRHGSQIYYRSASPYWR